MGTRDSMIQYGCGMQGRSVFGGICSTACSGERAIIFIQYLYISDTRLEARKRAKKCGVFGEVGPTEAIIEHFFDLGLAASVKTKDFGSLYILP